jgi:phosphatidylglycerol:prolipoprotein diacylglycerol transferase
MYQVLYRLKLPANSWLTQIPIYGFGFMLVVALFLCVWVAGRRARKEGIAAEYIQDVAFYLVIGGIVGARLVFIIQYRLPLFHFFNVWEGGLVWYGGLLGGALGYLVAHFRVLRLHNLSSWKVADVLAPTLALGLCLGRVGCLLNGCCWGGVACTQCPSLHFPVHSFPGGIHNPERKGLVPEGYQAVAGFTMEPGVLEKDSAVVGAVDASSNAARAGLQPGDVIVKANGHDIFTYGDLEHRLLGDPRWERGETDLQLTVLRKHEAVDLPAFQPRTLGLYPTQIFESISMLLLFLLLTAYYPFRRHDGEVLLLFLTLYPIHRFLNEMLRNDTDPLGDGLTLSQNGSLLILAVALSLWIWVLRRPAQYHPFSEAPTRQRFPSHTAAAPSTMPI